MTKKFLLLVLVFCVTVPLNAQIITSVVRSNGASGDRDPVGAYDGSTAPLPMEEGGLKDGNLVFSDRTYPWSGIPAEYEGTEYIRTFNSDKDGGTVDVTYEVTTSQDAIVWITVDDRIPAEWDSGGTITSQQDAADRVTAAIGVQFEDTGIDIYVHENDTTDRSMSVFAAELPAGTYVFDSMDSGKNFYNIGAIPAEAAEQEPEVPALSDVTNPGDPILGVPNDGDWPSGEYPALAIDDSSGTKFLHFKGPQGITGIQVTPSAGATIVTGLTFTTANDAPERDPVAFELSGSNVGIDGPYEVIATGDIVDFAQADPWPRFTKNETPISFDNDVAYTNYQVIITAVRDPATANSMQVSEIELLGVAVNAFGPSPANGAKGVDIDTELSWSPGADAVSSDVYFGTETPPPLLGNVEGSSISPGTLEYGTTYYWQVNTVKADGSLETGAVWSFTTTVPVGIFEYNQDIGSPAGIGMTTFEGYVWKDDMLTEQYLMLGSGADIWGNADQFHFAFNKVSGDIRISASADWVVASNDWAKVGVMLRETTGGPSAQYSMLDRKARDYAAVQGRTATGNSSSAFGTEYNATNAKALGIQRVTFAGKTYIEGLVDKGDGNGWQSTAFVPADLSDELLAGVAITSHDNTQLVEARVWNVEYEANPSIVKEFPVVPADAALAAPPSDVSGFSIRGIKPLVTDGWGYDAMNELLDTGSYKGLPALPGSEATRISQYVNLRDNANGDFSSANGFPDEPYPGIDPPDANAEDTPVAGDDDDNFAIEVLGVIHLSAGVHVIGANSDDGTIIDIGGIEIGRTAEAKGNSDVDFIFNVEADGYYNLRARYLEIGGGASLELQEVLADGTRILLNDVADGGSEVYAPAP